MCLLLHVRSTLSASFSCFWIHATCSRRFKRGVCRTSMALFTRGAVPSPVSSPRSCLGEVALSAINAPWTPGFQHDNDQAAGFSSSPPCKNLRSAWFRSPRPRISFKSEALLLPSERWTAARPVLLRRVSYDLRMEHLSRLRLGGLRECASPQVLVRAASCIGRADSQTLQTYGDQRALASSLAHDPSRASLTPRSPLSSVALSAELRMSLYLRLFSPSPAQCGITNYGALYIFVSLD